VEIEFVLIKFEYMEALVIHPESVEQLKKVKDFLNAQNIRFENHSQLPSHVVASIKRGMEQYQNGQFVSLDDFKMNHFSKK
jgi:hypothetical protein